MAAAAGNNIGTGAAAGGVSEIANGVLQKVLKADPNLTDGQKTAITQWVAAMVGAATGGQAGAAAALDNINHNYLDHQEKTEELAAKGALKSCQQKAGSCSKARIKQLVGQITQLEITDATRDAYLKAVCANGANNSGGCWNAIDALLKAKATYPGTFADSTALNQELQHISQLYDANSPAQAKSGQEMQQATGGLSKGGVLGVLAFAGTVAAVDGLPALYTCVQNPLCRTHLGEAIADAAMGDALGGASLSVSTAASGGVVAVKVGNKVVSLIEDGKQVLTRVDNGADTTALFKSSDGDFFRMENGQLKAVDRAGGQATNRTVKVDVSNVKKGTPEYDALNNPKPNTTTELSNGTTFKTGKGGYVDEITYKPVNSSGVRDSRQTTVGKEGISGDVGGHIQACRHGGTCDRFNLFPQNSNFNNSAYKKWENQITRSLQNGDDVGNVTVRLNRADPFNPRPDSLTIEYKINGVPFEKKFNNQAGQ